MTSAPLKQLEMTVLYHLYASAQGGHETQTRAQLAAALEDIASRPLIQFAIEGLGQQGLTHSSTDGDGLLEWVRLKRAGYLEVEEHLRDPKSYFSELSDHGLSWADTDRISSIVPAANRTVAPNDNERRDLFSSISELKKAVVSNQDNSFLDKEERLAELAALEQLLAPQNISIELVEMIVRSTIVPLATRFADQSIGIAAGTVITAVAAAFGMDIVP